MRRALALALIVACTAPTPSVVPPSQEPVALPTSRAAAARPIALHVIGPAGAVPDAKVCATRIGGEEQCATTDEQGRAVARLASGTYSIRATPPAGKRLDEGVANVDLREATTAVVVLEGKTTITGTIRDDSRRALADAEVCAHGATLPDVECVRTRADGTYVLEVKPGIHKVEASGPPGSRLLPQWARGRMGSFEGDPVDTRTADVTALDMVLLRGVVLAGRVTGASDGTPVEDAQVCTYTLAAPLGWECERTDKHGDYAALREPGTYWVWTIPPGKRGSRLMYQRYDRVLAGVNATPLVLGEDRRLDVALPDGSFLRGRVTASDGEPVVLALVCVDTPFPTGRICRETDAGGSYEVATRNETYVVNVYPPDGSDVVAGFWPDAEPDWTRAGEVVVRGDSRRDIVLPRGFVLRGTVRDSRGVPVEGATVNVNEGSVPRYFAGTDIHGRYSVAVRPGSYTIDVFAPRYIYSVSVMGQRIDVSGETGYDVVLPDATAD